MGPSYEFFWRQNRTLRTTGPTSRRILRPSRGFCDTPEQRFSRPFFVIFASRAFLAPWEKVRTACKKGLRFTQNTSRAFLAPWEKVRRACKKGLRFTENASRALSSPFEKSRRAFKKVLRFAGSVSRALPPPFEKSRRACKKGLRFAASVWRALCHSSRSRAGSPKSGFDLLEFLVCFF